MKKYTGIIQFWVVTYRFKDCNGNGGGAKV